MSFFIFLICSLGICYAWSDTEISVPIRNAIAKIPYIRKPLLCHECSSFWISLLLSVFFNPIDNMHEIPIISNLILAFCGFFVNLYFVRNHLIQH